MCGGDSIVKAPNMGSVGRCEGDGELTICAKLAQAPADHLLRWQKTSGEVEVGLVKHAAFIVGHFVAVGGSLWRI